MWLADRVFSVAGVLTRQSMCLADENLHQSLMLVFQQDNMWMIDSPITDVGVSTRQYVDD